MAVVHIFQLKYVFVIAVAITQKNPQKIKKTQQKQKKHKWSTKENKIYFKLFFYLLVLKSYTKIFLVADSQMLTGLPVWFSSQVLMTWGSDTNEQPS